jgi:hypothetical protein
VSDAKGGLELSARFKIKQEQLRLLAQSLRLWAIWGALRAQMKNMPEELDPCLADALLLLAADESQNLNAYARMAGVSKSVMASNFMELSDRACEPLGLVAWIPHPLEPRTSQVFLTPWACSL